MNEGSGVLVFWILVPLFVAVGLHLILYSRRRKKILAVFANEHQFFINPEYEKELQMKLDNCFTLEGEGLVRSFGQLSSLVEGESVWLFRAVELLDVNPHAQSCSTHFNRIAAIFDLSNDHDEFFLLDKSMQASQKLPKSKPANPEIIEIAKQTVVSCEARHTLSITLKHGHGLIYFEPLVTGGETNADVNSLYCIAKTMSEKLS